MNVAVVEAGRSAWRRLQNREKASWQDWLAVGEALIVGRAGAMKVAKTNKPMGSKYNRAMGLWLTANGFSGISAQERYRAILVIENRDEIDRWRETLTDRKRRMLNHPGACWHAWRRAIQPPRRAEASPEVLARISEAVAGAKSGRPVYWSQAAVERAWQAMLKSRSNDFLTLARAALQGAIRNEADLVALLEQPKAARARAEAELAA